MTKVDWPDISFPPVNLYIVIPAKEFYELMEEYGIPNHRLRDLDVGKWQRIQSEEQTLSGWDTLS